MSENRTTTADKGAQSCDEKAYLMSEDQPDRSHTTTEMDRTIREIVHRSTRIRCEDCGKNWADYPSKLCPGCEAYREHTGAL